MKNNTKLIMETWRKFIKEGPQDDEGQFKDPDEQYTDSDVPLDGDEDLGRKFADHESPYYPEDDLSHDSSRANYKDAYSDLPPNYEENYEDDDYYGDPAIQTGDAPMLGMSGDDGEDYETGDSEYESGSTFNGMPSEEFYDYSDDSEGDL